jgi:hypothetical protein
VCGDFSRLAVNAVAGVSVCPQVAQPHGAEQMLGVSSTAGQRADSYVPELMAGHTAIQCGRSGGKFLEPLSNASVNAL